MIDLAIRHFALPLRHPFTISRGTVAVQDTVIVQLGEQGCHGYGEATTNPYYGATVESLTRQISAVAPLLRRCTTDDLEGLLDGLAAELGDDMFARCALDMAAHDLWGKRLGRPVHGLWGLDPAAGPLSNYTIGIDTPERMVAKLAEVPGWPIYKIKLGTDRDLEIVRELREIDIERLQGAAATRVVDERAQQVFERHQVMAAIGGRPEGAPDRLQRVRGERHGGPTHDLPSSGSGSIETRSGYSCCSARRSVAATFVSATSFV